MDTTAGAGGEAHRPTVVAANDVGALQAALAVAIERQAVEQAETEGPRNVESLKAGIAKLEAHLAHHKELLAAAEAAEAERLAAKEEPDTEEQTISPDDAASTPADAAEEGNA